MLIGKDIKDEEKYLSNTIDTINSLLNNYGVSSSKQDKSIIEHRKFLWDNRSELDEIEINENCGQVALEEKLYASKLSRIKTLERQLKSPYFARLDFKEDGEEVESFYIGLSTVENEEDFEFIVFDWRSPVSNMFYDFEVGPAYYKAPNRTINGQIEFSRQFNIKNGKIVFMHNSNESLCDENLSTMLSRNATEKMKNIVATIQKEQNDIIRNDDSKILFIQGAAGSGKTSIALHRAAYLLYKNRKNLTADNILIFSPNEVFAEYISDVLPDLGESNILQTTFELYSKRFLPTNYIFESKNDHLDYIYSVDRNSDSFKIRANSMEYKNTTEFMHILDKYTNDLPNHLIEIRPIIIDNNEVISKSSVKKTFLNRFKDIMSSNINALLDKVEDPMKMIDQYLRNLESDLGKVKAETAAVMAEETKSKRELDECMDSINKMQTYAEKALLSGNEADARTFLSKKGELNNKLISLQQTYNIAKENSTKMREMHDKLIKDISQLNTRRDELKAKMAVANTQEKLNKIGSSVNGAIGNMSKFDEMEAKINKKLDTANAMAELNNSQKEENIEDLIAKYDNETKNTSSEIDDELSELKSKLGLDK